MADTQTAEPESSVRSLLQTTVGALLVVVFAGLVADLVLWPRDELPAVAAADQSSFFSAAFLARAGDFRSLQSWLAIAAGLMTVALPLAIAWWWPRGAARSGWFARWRDRRSGALFGRGGPLAWGLVGAGVAALTMLAALPLELLMFFRARDVGLLVQGFGGWIFDWLLSGLLALLAAALLAALCGFLVKRLPRGWWAAFGACLVLLTAGFQALAPVVIAPLFAEFSELPAGALRSDVEQVAKKSGVDAGELFVVDAARRTTGANAYVSGLGSTRRVVIYDTLVSDFNRAERRQVIAHEFGHARRNDLLAGLIWFAFVAMISMFAVDRLARALAERRGVEFGTPASAAMILAVAMLCVLVSQPAANAFSRAIEARADAFALAVTEQPNVAISLERRLTIQNLARPEPPRALQVLLGTHPTPMQRIGMALTVRREHAAGRREPLP
jgi:STE24 endopeptidase